MDEIPFRWLVPFLSVVNWAFFMSLQKVIQQYTSYEFMVRSPCFLIHSLWPGILGHDQPQSRNTFGRTLMVKGNYCKAHFLNTKELKWYVQTHCMCYTRIHTVASLYISKYKNPQFKYSRCKSIICFLFFFNLLIIPNNYSVPQMCQIIHISF